MTDGVTRSAGHDGGTDRSGGRGRGARALATLRLARLRVERLGRRAWFRWRASLQIRVITSTLVLGLVAVLASGGYLSNRIASGLFDQRLAQALEESARATEQAQARLSASNASTGSEVQELIFGLVRALQQDASGVDEVFLRRAPGEPPPLLVTDASTDPELVGVIPFDLRQAVRTSEVQRWVSVGIPEDETTRVRPGLLIGSMVRVPQVGPYELYYLYDLQPEQDTLWFVHRVLALAGGLLVAIVVGMTWLVTRQAVQPVRAAARVAERLAEGNLDQRMTVRGVDEMATLAGSFNEMAESLQDQIRRMEELSHLQRRFVSDVSHELRTPLTTVRMAAEVIHASRDELDPGARRSAELLTAELDRFEDLLADLLEISRFDAGAAVLDAEARDVRDVVTTVVEQAAPLASRRGVWLRVDLPADAVVADVDPRRVERILRNLVVNAVEHAEGRPVEVRLGANPGALAITVRDHGVGMTIAEAAHVFDRFWRADPARARTTGGTGLGLAISIEDAHLHAGWLEAWGRPGHGSCFRLTLPRRAGIALTSSPLPLEPPDDEPDESAAEHDGADADPGTDPAAVPDLDRLEA